MGSIVYKKLHVSLSRKEGLIVNVGPFGLFILPARFHWSPLGGHHWGRYDCALWLDWLGIYASVDRYTP